MRQKDYIKLLNKKTKINAIRIRFISKKIISNINKRNKMMLFIKKMKMIMEILNIKKNRLKICKT